MSPKLLLLVPVVALLLAACQNVGPSKGQSLPAFTLADLQNAQTLACTQMNGAQADPQGCTCYTALVPYAQAVAANIQPSGATSATQTGNVGAVSVLEMARLAGNAPLAPALQTACAPLILSIQNQGLTFAALIAVLAPK